MISISDNPNRPDTIWIEEELTKDGRWVERRRWTKPQSFPFNPDHRKAYIQMMMEHTHSTKIGVRFVEGKIDWEVHEQRVADGR